MTAKHTRMPKYVWYDGIKS